MQSAVDRVMTAYRLMVNLTPAEDQAAREKLEKHLARIKADEDALAVEGLRYLRDMRPRRTRGRRENGHSGRIDDERPAP